MVITKPIECIKLNGYNPNVMDAAKYAALKTVIGKYGFLQPILIDKEGTIIDGEHRFRAMKELGRTEIDCIVLESEEDREEYRKLLTIAMNNVRGTSDEDKLRTVLKELSSFMTPEDITASTGILESDIRLLMNYADIPDIEVPALEKEDGTDSIKSSQFVFGDKRLVISDREMEEFESAHGEYVAQHGNDVGFIVQLLDNAEQSITSDVEAKHA
ncbi:MAG: ParB N-terminal domain-containing protein [Spirochaetes bacterium]|nr:ParB N-terminal domain-containing protein [Spirochaetota bacterium]